MMKNSTVSDQTAVSLLGFLDDELAFLSRVEQCADRLGKHPIAQAFQDELVNELISFREDIATRNQQRAITQARLAAECSTGKYPRLSTIRANAEVTELLQRRRREVLRKALTVESILRTVLVQLSESHAVLNAVIESILGAATDTSRYNSAGRPVLPGGHIEGRRVA
ncbi:MAG: hypothetical protein R3C49_26905 [Planctomycetaceae bacterium]